MCSLALALDAYPSDTVTQTGYGFTSCRKLWDSDLTRSQLESVIAAH